MKRTKSGEPVAARLRRRAVVVEGGCWEWQGHLDPKGYARVTITTDEGTYRAGILAHRLAFETFVGPIPDGLVLDHLCRNRSCINPEHLEPVTQQENIRRSPVAPQAVNARKTHCKHGHEFTPENTRHYIKNGRPARRCIECGRTYRKRAAA